jgi:uncharacterized protein with gpF-like domain
MPSATADAIDRGFLPAIEFFRKKVNLPTATWRDLWQAAHARAFVVAGAMKEDLLADLRAAVDAAIADGESFDAFRKRFRDIVARHGWVHTGGEAWRARVIWHTNMRTAFAAGRYQQMVDPEVVAHMPYWLYDHSTLLHPREQHRAWDNLVLRHDDPWWDTHYPPNGWGCNCRVRPLSARQLRKLGKEAPDAAPVGGEPVPPEWAYHVGKAGLQGPA